MVSNFRIGVFAKIIIPLSIAFSSLTYFASVVILDWFKQEQITEIRRHSLDTLSETAMLFDVDVTENTLRKVATVIALNEHVELAYIIDPIQEKIVASSKYRHSSHQLDEIPFLAMQAYETVLKNKTWFFTDLVDGNFALAYPVSGLNVSKLDAIDYVLVVYFDDLILQNQYYDYKRNVVGTASAFLFFLILFTYLLLYNYIKVPLRAFEKSIKNQTQSQDYESLAIDTHDEFGDLSREFSRMRAVEKQSLKLAREAADKAQLLADKKSQFLANMSHEIRTPINGILGLAQLSEQATSKKEIDRNLAMLRESTQLLLTVVNDVLDYSKLEKHGIIIHKQSAVLSKMVANITQLIQVTAKRKNLDFNINIGNLSPYSVVLDAKRVQQVLLNILNNAIKFTQCGYVNLDIDFEWRNSQYGLVSFRIKDSGIGISKKQQQHLFEPFEQADNSVSRDYGGTGLGLAISKELVELMGGVITIESELGKGSEFSIIIPCEAISVVSYVKQLQKEHDLPKLVSKHALHDRSKFIVDAVNGISQSTKTVDIASLDLNWHQDPFLLDEQAFFDDLLHDDTHVEQLSDDKPSNTLRVLLAEDNEINAIVQCNMLELIGCQVTTVKNGREAVIAMNQEQIDLILMDVQMPIMDGIEATHIIRKSHPNIPIIGLSANTFEEDKLKALNSGMNEYLHKPVLQEELAEALKPYARKQNTNDITLKEKA